MSVEFHYTPKDIAKKLLKDINFVETDRTLEAGKGLESAGGFWDLIPYTKDWLEVEEGRDIFTYEFEGKFTKVIANPPYRNNAPDGQRKNILIKFIEKCFELCSDECWILTSHKLFNSLTPTRLGKWGKKGFKITFIRVLNIKKWFGRYYWICFKQGGTSLINY